MVNKYEQALVNIITKLENRIVVLEKDYAELREDHILLQKEIMRLNNLVQDLIRAVRYGEWR